MNGELGIWPTIWFWVILLGGVLFLGTLAYSIVAGARDIKELFIALSEPERPEQEESD